MKIPLTDLRWYAAFHNESYHPHIHMVAYSVGKEPYLTKQGIRNIKAAFARQIFKHDLMQVYIEQTNQRNALVQQSRDVLSDIISRINSGSYDNPIVTDLLVKLSEQMKNYKGKKVYGYLPQAGRNIVNAIVDELAKVYQIDCRIADINAQNLVVAQLHNKGILNNAEFTTQSGELSRKVSELRSERRRILMEDEDDELIDTLRDLNETLAEYIPSDTFDEDLFEQIVESITVISGQKLSFRLAGGLVLTEKI